MSSNEMSIKGSEERLNGLQFGEKMYFEEVGIGVCGKRGNGSKRNGSKTKCQVEGCMIDLIDAKAYYLRHKVCGIHSKSPLVVVNGIQQRFCQQCSRVVVIRILEGFKCTQRKLKQGNFISIKFHKLPEFDQGKRSCRRRLAGHNERRRKPTPGSLLSSRLGQLSSSLFGGSTSRDGFLLDFSSYPRHSGRDSSLSSKTSESGLSGSQLTSLGKFQHNLWPGNSEGHPPQMYLQGSGGDTSYSIQSGEYITGGATDSTCALSLLSNETWGSRTTPSGTDIGNLMNLGAPVSQCTSTHSVTVAQLPGNNSSWSLHGASADHVGLGQISHPLNGQFHSDLFMDQAHDGRQYVEVDQSGGYGNCAASHVDWSL